MHRHDVKGTKEKGYDRRWCAARTRFLKAQPLCVKCLERGRLEKAAVVDHIVPHRGDRELFWDEKNWQALCKSCHDTKTMTEDRLQKFTY
jgi:5-methylcytosine-specific restriction protein A